MPGWRPESPFHSRLTPACAPGPCWVGGCRSCSVAGPGAPLGRQMAGCWARWCRGPPPLRGTSRPEVPSSLRKVARSPEHRNPHMRCATRYPTHVAAPLPKGGRCKGLSCGVEPPLGPPLGRASPPPLKGEASGQERALQLGVGAHTDTVLLLLADNNDRLLQHIAPSGGLPVLLILAVCAEGPG